MNVVLVHTCPQHMYTPDYNHIPHPKQSNHKFLVVYPRKQRQKKEIYVPDPVERRGAVQPPPQYEGTGQNGRCIQPLCDQIHRRWLY